MTPYIFTGMPIEARYKFCFDMNWMHIEKVVNLMCKTFNIDEEKLRGNSRKREFVEPRQIAIGIILERNIVTLSNLGRYFGDRDHSTISYNRDTYSDLLRTNKQFRFKVNTIKNLLYGTDQK